jgi:hypothetical protein
MKKLRNYLFIFWTSFFILILAMGVTRHVLLNGPRINGGPREAVLFLSSIVTKALNFYSITKPLIINDNFHLKNGLNYSKNYLLSKDYLLVSVWDDKISQSIVKLGRIYDGKELHRWTPDIDEIIKQFNSINIYGTDNNLFKSGFRLGHPFLMNDGSLIIGFLGIGGGIFKINNNSKFSWINTYPSHHSIEQDSEGNFWICGYNSSSINSDKYHIQDDAIQKISAVDGKILFEKSVFEILLENGYGRGVFFINPQISVNLTYLDYSHLNEVQPVLEDSRFWKKGDLFISLRHQNLVFLYRPTTNKIIWSQNGPWLRQHSVSIIDSTRIGIFGNNVLDALFPNENDRFIDGNNREYVYDFATNKVTTPYDEFFKSSKIRTFLEGRARILPNGEIFVEETNKGRLLYGNQKEEIWSYIEKIGEDKVSMFNWCRYITEDEFKKLTFVSQNNN